MDSRRRSHRRINRSLQRRHVTWRPAIAQSPSTNMFSISLKDSSSPNLRATGSFTVTVMPPSAPQISAPSVRDGLLQFNVGGITGPDYIIQTSTNLSLSNQHGNRILLTPHRLCRSFSLPTYLPT